MGEVSSWMCCIDGKEMGEVLEHFGMFPSKKNLRSFSFQWVKKHVMLLDSFGFLSILYDPGQMPPKHWQNHDQDNRKLLYIYGIYHPPSRIPTANKGLYPTKNVVILLVIVLGGGQIQIIQSLFLVEYILQKKTLLKEGKLCRNWTEVSHNFWLDMEAF